MNMVLRITDPEIEQSNWRTAIDDLLHGDQSLLLFLLRREKKSEIPEFGRAAITDMLEGKLRKPRGRPRHPRYKKNWLAEAVIEFQIRQDYLRFHAIERALATFREPGARAEMSPKERAFHAVAKKWHYKVVKPEAVGHIMYPRRGRKT